MVVGVAVVVVVDDSAAAAAAVELDSAGGLTMTEVHWFGLML